MRIFAPACARTMAGPANGTGAGNLGVSEIASPGLFKIIATSPSNAKYVLDEFLVPKDSAITSIAQLKGKRVASGPGIQNRTLAMAVLERAGAGGTSVTELPIGQHVASLAAGQVDAVYTLEPTGTVGRLNGGTRVLESGVIARYILGDPLAPWHGGAAIATKKLSLEIFQREVRRQALRSFTPCTLVQPANSLDCSMSATSPACCTGCQSSRCCVNVLDALSSMPENMPSQPKWAAASSGDSETTGIFRPRPMASAMSRSGTPCSPTAWKREPAAPFSSASR